MRPGIEPHPPGVASVINGIEDVVAILQDRPTNRHKPSVLSCGLDQLHKVGVGIVDATGAISAVPVAASAERIVRFISHVVLGDRHHLTIPPAPPLAYR